MSGAVTLDVVYAQMRKEIAAAGGQSAWAAQVGLSPQVVSDAVNARREPGPAVLAVLGLRRVTRYVTVRPAT